MNCLGETRFLAARILHFGRPAKLGMPADPLAGIRRMQDGGHIKEGEWLPAEIDITCLQFSRQEVCAGRGVGQPFAVNPDMDTSTDRGGQAMPAWLPESTAMIVAH